MATALARPALRRRRADRRPARAGRIRPLPRPARRGSGDRRGRQHARARLGEHRRDLGLRGRPQPLGPRALPGRLLERPRRGGRRRARRRVGGRRRARLDPLPGRLLRADRAEADLRPLGDGGASPRRGHPDDRLRCPHPRRRGLPAARLGPLRRGAARGRAQGVTSDRCHPRPALGRLRTRRGRGVRDRAHRARRGDRRQGERGGAPPVRPLPARRPPDRPVRGGGEADAAGAELARPRGERDQPGAAEAPGADPRHPHRPRLRRPGAGPARLGRALRADRPARLARRPGAGSPAQRPAGRACPPARAAPTPATPARE